VCKYGLLALQELPLLGRSEQAQLLEAQLAGFTAPNVLADALGTPSGSSSRLIRCSADQEARNLPLARPG